MKGRKYLFIAMPLAVVLLESCSSMKPALMEGGQVRNPTVGKDGYEFSIPQGFEFLPRPSAPREKPSTSTDRWVAQSYRTFPLKGEGLVGGEQFVFKRGEQAIFFSVILYSLEGVFSMLYDSEKKQMLRDAGTHIYGLRGLKTSKEIQVAGHHALEVDNFNSREELYEHGYVILGDLNEMYVFVGASPSAEKEDMKKALSQVVQSFAL